jgi:RNA recognition motif-containing protein
MQHGLIGLIKTTFDPSLVDEKFVSRLIGPIAATLDIRVVRCSSHARCFLKFSCADDVLSVIRAFDGKSFAWGSIELTEWSEQSDAEEKETQDLKKLPTDTSIKNSPIIVTKFDLLGETIDRPKPSDLANPPLISECFEVRQYPFSLSSEPPHDLRRISTNDEHSQCLPAPFYAHETSSHPNLSSPNQSRPISRIASITNFDSRKLNAKSLANLFGAMGNVHKVVVNDSKNIGFIEFEVETDAQKSMQFLQNMPLFGQHLAISKAQSDFSLEQYIQFERRSLQVHCVQTSLQRYRNYFGIRVNPPSSILHFTNIDDRLDAIVLYSLISVVQEPETLYLLRQRSHNSRMFLVKFKCIPHAVEVLTALHNKQVGSRALKISFSKMKV